MIINLMSYPKRIMNIHRKCPGPVRLLPTVKGLYILYRVPGVSVQSSEWGPPPSYPARKYGPQAPSERGTTLACRGSGTLFTVDDYTELWYSIL
jgi:hypothetical protein